MGIKKEAFEMLLRRKFALLDELFVKGEEAVGLQLATTFNRNLEYFGFTLDEKALRLLSEVSLESFNLITSEVTRIIKDMTGMEIVDALIMYPNFPEQVMHMEESELYFNAIVHYLSGGSLLPKYELVDREGIEVDVLSLAVITVGTMKDLDDIFVSVCNSQIAVSGYDMEIVTWYINFVDRFKELMPEDIPNKENKAKITHLVMTYKPEEVDCLYSMYKAPTDVLRLAVTMTYSEASLEDKVRFRNFSRKERRCLLALLNNCGNLAEDMFKRREQWLRLGRALNPGDYANKYKKAANAFKMLRMNKKPVSFYSRVDKALREDNIDEVVNILSERPGDFARTLNRVIVNCNSLEQQMEVAKAYGKCVHKASTNVLWSVIKFFENRNRLETRAFLPKGNLAKVFIVDNELVELDKEVVRYIVNTSMRGLIAHYSERETLGKVYIEEDMAMYKIPTVMRNMSESLKCIGRGSRVKLNTDKNIIRPFIYWKDNCDIDLSVLCLGSDFTNMAEVYYGNLVNHELGIYHSGDLVDGSCGASEYIDVDIEKCLKAGVRYVVVSVNSFRHKDFCDLGECFCGVMHRDEPRKQSEVRKNIFEPSTILNKSDLTAKAIENTPMIIDLVEKEMIWLDLPVAMSYLINNVMSNKRTITGIVKAMINNNTPSIKEVVELNVRARMGELVATREEADLVVGTGEGSHLTPYALTELSANWL